MSVPSSWHYRTGPFRRASSHWLHRVACAAGLVLVVGVRAQTAVTWTGATSNTWDLAANWSGGVPTSGNVATFANTVTNATPALTAATTYDLAGVAVADGSSWITLRGGDFAHLRVGASGLSSSGAGAITLNWAGKSSRRG